jgi:hypothetical protein
MVKKMIKETYRWSKLFLCLIPLLLISASITGPASAAITVYVCNQTAEPGCTDAAKEQAYRDHLAALGFTVSTAREGFEDDLTWPRFLSSALSVSNLGITWSRLASQPVTAGITTSTANPHSGSYEMFSFDSNTFSHPIQDGYSLTTGSSFPLYGVGGWFRSAQGAKLAFSVDGDSTRVNFTGEEATVFGWKFLGFVEDNVNFGFSTVAIHSVEDAAEQRNTFFSDDFTFGAEEGAFSPDNDGDGVNDSVDQCPNTPAGDTVDAVGCSDSQLDDDGDQVSNADDLCPNTPAGETVDANGCSDSQDDDGDGVNNGLDQCPNTPANETADANGCSPSQLDDDNDGVNNDVDQCPNTPAGATVDANGCSPGQLDSDGDGVNDALDQCPNTPAGETVNAAGCSDSQLDDDNDGVRNDVYKCPNTTAGATVDANGCSPSQLDDDNDGVSNADDLCPNTPAGATVDANGCSPSQLDSDGDGVNDVLDQCPNTPAGAIVDETGCPLAEIIDLDIANFQVTKQVRTGGKKTAMVDIKLTVKNNGMFNDQSRPASVVGVQNGAVIYSEILQVSDAIGNGRSKFHFPAYKPLAKGNISWTVTIHDDDPDIDEGTATTAVK